MQIAFDSSYYAKKTEALTPPLPSTPVRNMPLRLCESLISRDQTECSHTQTAVKQLLLEACFVLTSVHRVKGD